MTNQAPSTEPADLRWSWLYQVSGAAAFLSGVLFLVALISLVSAVLQPGVINGWFSPLQDNWLVILFKLNAGFNGVSFDRLYGPDALDIAILALVGTMYLGLYTALRRASKVWSIIAAIQPFLGIVVFIATRTAGRSGVMGAGLVISLVMLRSKTFDKVTAFVGLLASVLLLAGDFGTTADSHSTILAIFIGIGYLLLMAWFFLLARRLFQLGRLGRKTLLQQPLSE